MTRDDIIRMAREAQSVYATETWTFSLSANQLERFAEREACAALLEANGMRCGEESLSRLILETNAAAIRARNL